MMQRFRALIIVAAILIIIAGFAVKKFLYYAADPIGWKECPPLFPSNTGTPVVSAISEPYPSSVPWEQRAGTVNDSSCLDQTSVSGVVEVRTEADISAALTFARANHLKVSIAGVRHSQGGHAFASGAIVLDMRKFNSVQIDETANTMTVGSGATWHDIQNVLHPKYAVKAMQSTDIFTVGGSISVNAHGMDHQAGSVGDTLRSARIMLPSGEVKTISRTENPDLFRHVVGGYGLFGVLLDVTLDIQDNVVYQSGRQVIATKDFPAAWAQIDTNKDIGLFYTHLSTAPHNLMDEAILYTYTKTDVDPLNSPPLKEVSSVKLRRLTINLSKLGWFPMELKWFTEKYIEPKMESCEISRTQAMTTGEGCLVARNEPMHDSVPYLKNSLKNDTDILHEYFIPRDNLMPFLAGMRDIFKKESTNILNISIRVLHKEDIALNYAPQDAFSVVLYINQTTDDAGNAKMKRVTRDLIDLTTANGGRFFLPYQLHYTKEQLRQSYPEIDDFFAKKRAIDPDGMFTNTWYETYGTPSTSV